MATPTQTPPRDQAPAEPVSPALAESAPARIEDRPARRRRRRGLWGRLSVQSKLLTMLLVVSILSVLVAGYFGYRSGSKALTEAAYNQLTSVRDARTRAIQSFFTGLQRSAILNSNNDTTRSAMLDFTRDFAALDSAKVSAADDAAVNKWYSDHFVPELAKNTEGEVTAASFEPETTAQRYLQAKYTARYTDFDKALTDGDAHDGSAWSATHAKYHPFFRQVVEQNGFEDAMLVDLKGNVVYTAYKGADLGTNLLTGPYRDSGLQQAYRNVLRANAVNALAFTDFEPYVPSANVPTAFGLSPIGVDGKLIGVLVIQLPVQGINNVMTTNREWSKTGLGESGEVFLVGPDQLMRSTSRQLIENPQVYRSAVVANGTPPGIADRVVASGNPILLQPIRSSSVDAALRGETGTTVETDYLGRRVLSSYAPITPGNRNWAIVAQIDEDEALRPVDDLIRVLGLSLLALVLVVTLASILLARAFSRPVQQLLTGVRRVAGGELGTRVELRTADEFGDLADAFNDMSASLATKQDLLDAQMTENDRMLANLMPETVARRYKEGEQNIVEEHQDVSVLFATLQGLDDLSAGRTPGESIALLNELVRGFDAAAERSGVEKVRTLRSGYIASCGLVVPRVDHALRMLDFAQEMVATVDRFESQYGGRLSIRIGIDTGTVTSGLVGSAAVYDMWGDSVNLAYRVQSVEDRPGIYLTERIYDKVRDAAAFESVQSVSTRDGDQRVWRLAGAQYV